MSLLQQLSSLGARAVAKDCSTPNVAATADHDAQSAEAACVYQSLQQLADSVAACKRTLSSKQQQGIGDPIQAVQDGLIASQQQLACLLQQQGCSRPQQQQQQQQQQSPLPGSYNAASHRAGASCALLVLQNLLELAVGTVHTHDAQHTAHTHSAMNNQLGLAACCCPEHQLVSAAQQQQWGLAAMEALQLFKLHEIEQLPPSSLHQALLLQPQLMDQLLQQAAATLMRPILGAAVPPPERLINQGSSSSSSTAKALGEAHPCWQQLPAILAANPLLMLKASGTLLAWLELNGQQRLWQLTSLTLRPAWQLMVAAATAQETGCFMQPVQAAAAAAGDQTAAGFGARLLCTNSSSGGSGADSQQVRAGAFALLCPEPWHQQLVTQLVQQPSEAGLLQLLQLLPGMKAKANDEATADGAHAGSLYAAMQDAARVERAAVVCPGAAADGGGGGGGGGGGDTGFATGWPSLQEWQGSWDQQQQWQQQQQPVNHTTAAADGAAERYAGFGMPTDMLSVVAAWRLVVQHRCWYEFACYLLVHCSITALQAQCQQDRQQQQQQQGQQQQQVQAKQHAGYAAALIAWVHEPADDSRRCQLQQQLLAPTTDAANAGMLDSAQAGAGSPTVLLQHSKALLKAWRHALVPMHSPAAAAAAVASGLGAVSSSSADGREVAAAHSTSSSSSSSSGLSWLADVDLPMAVMQQQELLLGCCEQQLMGLCFPGTVPGSQQGQCAAAQQGAPSPPSSLAATQQQQHEDQQKSNMAEHSTNSVQQHQWEPQQQVLVPHSAVAKRCCAPAGAGTAMPVLCAVLDGLDVVSAAAVEVLTASMQCNAQLMPVVMQQQQKQQQEQLVLCDHWLAKQWVSGLQCAGARGTPFGGSSSSSSSGSSPAGLMAQARRLLMAATACDKLLKSAVA